MVAKKRIGLVTLFSLLAMVGTVFAGYVNSAGCYVSSTGIVEYCQVTSSVLYQSVSQGVQSSTLIGIGSLSNLGSIFVLALFVLLIFVLVYLIAVKLILPFLQK